MTCEEALILISGKLDGANTDEELALLREHLESCPDCQRVRTALEELDFGLSALEAEPPADLKDHVMDVIRAEVKPKRRRWIPVAVSAAAVLLIVGAARFDPIQAEKTAVPSVASENAAPAVYSRALADTMAAPMDHQELADELGGDVAVTRDLLPEMEVCACETLEDGTLLYILESADAAAELSEQYGLELYQPAEDLETGVSYARLVP